MLAGARATASAGLRCRVALDLARGSLPESTLIEWCYHDGIVRRMMFQADDELLARAKRRAGERGVSVAQLVRDALEKELGDSGQVPPPARIIGVGRSERTDLSRLASEDLYEPEPWVSS